MSQPSGKNRFGYEWSRYPEIIPLYEEQFRAWTQPIPESAWKGCRVLDAGCGTGRNSLWPLKYGASEVVAFDVDPRTVDVARGNLAGKANARVIQSSIYDIPFENEFDIGFSIGVIHHLPDPKAAVERLVRAVKPGGTVLIWVYGWEGHTLAKVLVDAVRRVTCRVPLPVLNAILTPVSWLLWMGMRILPWRHPYMRQFRSASFRHVHSILFDQLLPEIAHYWKKEEALALFRDCPVRDLAATWTNRISWTVVCRKV